MLTLSVRTLSNHIFSCRVLSWLSNSEVWLFFILRMLRKEGSADGHRGLDLPPAPPSLLFEFTTPKTVFHTNGSTNYPQNSTTVSLTSLAGHTASVDVSAAPVRWPPSQPARQPQALSRNELHALNGDLSTRNSPPYLGSSLDKTMSKAVRPNAWPPSASASSASPPL